MVESRPEHLDACWSRPAEISEFQITDFSGLAEPRAPSHHTPLELDDEQRNLHGLYFSHLFIAPADNIYIYSVLTLKKTQTSTLLQVIATTTLLPNNMYSPFMNLILTLFCLDSAALVNAALYVRLNLFLLLKLKN